MASSILDRGLSERKKASGLVDPEKSDSAPELICMEGKGVQRYFSFYASRMEISDDMRI